MCRNRLKSARRHEEAITRCKSVSVPCDDQFSRATVDEIELVLLVRSLGVVAKGGVVLHGHAAMGHGGGKPFTRRAGNPPKDFLWRGFGFHSMVSCGSPDGDCLGGVMSERAVNRPALVGATLVGAVLQLGMMVGGHFSAPVANLLMVVGAGIAAVAGLLYGIWAGAVSSGSVAMAGALAGVASALLGFLVAYLLGDIPATILGPAMVGAALAGLLGGLLGSSLRRKEQA
jgi:hypothetical protein